VDRRIKSYIDKPIKAPFNTDRAYAQAIRKTFNEVLGQKVLEQTLIDYNYYLPDTPELHQQTKPQLSFQEFLLWRAAQKEVISTFIFGRVAEYVDRDILLNKETENYDD
jgi:hypothetical protein